jgi:hypothetical protein
LLCALDLALHLGGGFYALRQSIGGDRVLQRTGSVPEWEGFPDYGAMQNPFAHSLFSKLLNFND